MFASMPASHQRKPAASQSARLSRRSPSARSSSPSMRATHASDPSACASPFGYPSPRRKAGEALLGEVARAGHVTSPHRSVGETDAARIATERSSPTPAHDRESLLPALFRGVDLSDGVLHATLDTERARHDAVVNIGRPVEQRRGPLEAFLGQACHPVVLECDDQLQPELALAGLQGVGERYPNVVALGDDKIVTLGPFSLDGEVRRARDRQIVVEVTFPDDGPTSLSASASRRRARGSSRAEEPRELVLATTKEALVDERLDGVRSRSQTASAAPYVHPPANTDRPRKRLCSASSSRSWDHSIVARSVCWRGSASRPAVSRSRRSDSRSRSCCGEKMTVRAAASSRASGRLSSREQSSATDGRLAHAYVERRERESRRGRHRPRLPAAARRTRAHLGAVVAHGS